MKRMNALQSTGSLLWRESVIQAITTGLLILGLAGVASAQIVNGDFSAGFTGWTESGYGHVDVYFPGDWNRPPASPPTDGPFAGLIECWGGQWDGPHGSISQVVTGTPGAKLLRGDLFAASRGPDTWRNVGTEVLWNGVVVASIWRDGDPTRWAYDWPWVHFSVPVSATGADELVVQWTTRFAEWSWGGVDNLSLVSALPGPPVIEVSPTPCNLGKVELPGSATATVTLANSGESDLHISSVALAAGTSPYLSVKSAPAVPITLAAGSNCEVVLAFKPQTVGAATGALVIDSDDPAHGTVSVALTGNGVTSTAPPPQQLTNTLEFIESSVADGTLQGTGPAGAGNAHVQALMNQIKAASDQAAKGNVRSACSQLQNVLRLTDGNPTPPDFVSGLAAAELKLLIELTMASLGCP